MTLSKSGIRQLLREYFEDYNTDNRFVYAFDKEQLLIKESVNRSEGVAKHIIIQLFDEYMESYNIKENFIYDMQNCHFLIALQTVMFKELPDNQIIITSDSGNGLNPFLTKKEFDKSKTKHIFNKGFGENEVLS